jgi:hypothetical protein
LLSLTFIRAISNSLDDASQFFLVQSARLDANDLVAALQYIDIMRALGWPFPESQENLPSNYSLIAPHTKTIICCVNQNDAFKLAAKLGAENYKFLAPHATSRLDYQHVLGDLHKDTSVTLIADNFVRAIQTVNILACFCNIRPLAFNGTRLLTFQEVENLQSKRILFVAMPKSGSAWIKSNLENTFITTAKKCFGGSWSEAPGQQISISDFTQFMNGRPLAKGHIAPSRFNRAVLELAIKKNPLFRGILHVRDPRQALVSWMKFAPKITGYLRATLEERHPKPTAPGFDYYYKSFYLPMVKFICDWCHLLDNSPLGQHFLITTHEELAMYPTVFNRKIAEWIEVDSQDLSLDRTPAAGEQHFRRGRTDEWENIFRDNQIKQLNAALPVTIAKRFKWKLPD